MKFLKMQDLELKDKRVLIREDFNVPLKDGRITSDVRLQAAIPTIKLALEKGARIILCSHLGRPKEGEYDPQFSLEPVRAYLSEVLGKPITLVTDYLKDTSATSALSSGEIALLENVRFNVGEKDNDETLAKQLANLCDVFVHDAFGTAHRAQASTHGVAQYAKIACAGPLLAAELAALGKATQKPKNPVIAIVGGSKVSGKLELLENLADKVDHLIVGGGIANTFLLAAGYSIGQSLAEPELVDKAKRIILTMEEKGGKVPLPVDVVVGQKFSNDAPASVKPCTDIAASDMIFDFGPLSLTTLSELIAEAGTILWNGPLGVFEFDQFGEGTKALAQAIANSSAFSIAGGGDTLAAIEKYQVKEKVSYISTGGGAFLEFLEGKTLPAIAVLESRYAG